MKIFPLRRNLLSQKLISSEGSRVSKTAWGTQITLIDVQKISLFQSILGYLRLSLAILDSFWLFWTILDLLGQPRTISILDYLRQSWTILDYLGLSRTI